VKFVASFVEIGLDEVRDKARDKGYLEGLSYKRRHGRTFRVDFLNCELEAPFFVVKFVASFVEIGLDEIRDKARDNGHLEGLSYKRRHGRTFRVDFLNYEIGPLSLS